jgi:hypothetical protein
VLPRKGVGCVVLKQDKSSSRVRTGLMEGWRDGSPAGRSERRRSRLSGCAPEGLSRGRASEVGRGFRGVKGVLLGSEEEEGVQAGCARRRGCGCGAEGPNRGFLRVRALASMQARLLAKRAPAWMWRTVEGRKVQIDRLVVATKGRVERNNEMAMPWPRTNPVSDSVFS